MKKVNVLFVIMQMELGGSERLVLSLIRGLDRNIFNISLAWFHGDRVLKEFEGENIRLHHVPKLKRLDLGAMKKLAKIIRDDDIHVVNAHHFMPAFYSFYGSKVANSCKLLCTEHSSWEINEIPRLWRTVGRVIFKYSEGVIGVSGGVADTAKKVFRLAPSKIFRIDNGVDLGERPSGTDTASLRGELGIAADDVVITIVANLKTVKNHIFLLKAFRDLFAKRTGLKLLLAGQGFKGDQDNTEEEILNFTDSNGLKDHVIMLGYRPDVASILAVSDIFCLTSLREGLPISLIEAMASGLPSVGTDVEGIKDVIVDGQNGFLVGLNNVDELREALSRLVDDKRLRTEMGQEAKRFAERSYSLKKCISETQDLFLALTNNKH